MSTGRSYGVAMRAAESGKVLFGTYSGRDTSRGMIGDEQPGGSEALGLNTAQGKAVDSAIPGTGQSIRWSGDLTTQILNGSGEVTGAKERLTRIHARAANLRREVAHQLSHWCATRITMLTVEDLNIAGMGKLRTLARAVADAGMGDLGRLLAYKAAGYGLDLIVADRWFPSSKRCSRRGHVKAKPGLGERVYRCDGPHGCGLVLDRDVNTAVNLAQWQPPQPSPKARAA